MSLHEGLVSAIRTEIDSLGGALPLSPTTLAEAVQSRFAAGKVEPHIQYASLEHIKSLCRRALARRYDPDGEENTAHQGTLFAGLLQDAYPLPPRGDADPIYKPLGLLSDNEVRWNIEQLRKSADARRQHAEALEAWLERRRRQARRRAA